jgi:hypothetical protein
MPSRSSAAIAVCHVVGGKMLNRLVSVDVPVQLAEHHVGHHVETRHQVELLEDHGAFALPAAHHAALEAENVAVFEEDLPGGRRSAG